MASHENDLEKVTIRLTRGAKDELQTLFPSLGHNKVIRTLVDNFLKGVREGAQRKIKPSDVQVSLEDLE